MSWLPYEKRLRIYNRDGFRCRYCRCTVFEDKSVYVSPRAATLDHVLARSEGGDNSMRNLVTSCRSCNMLKGNGKFPNDRRPDPMAHVTTRDQVSEPERVRALARAIVAAEG